MVQQGTERRGRVLVYEAACVGPDLVAALERRGFQIEVADPGVSALERVAEGKFAVMVTELGADVSSGVSLYEQMAEKHPMVNVLVITRSPRLDTALAAMRAGAYDYVTWPQPVDAFALALDRALRNRNLQREVRRLRRALNPGLGFEGIIGESPAMREVFELMSRVATARAPVLVTGETGTGKELVARAVHRAGKRTGPFVAVNCAALPEQLLESELFGHVKGAFTDARTSNQGLFVRANGGTLFLDEIGDMPLAIQAKLLRALQSKTVRPVGGDEEVPFDARLVTATNRDLDSMVEAGTFREDLYYRIHVIHIELPPLRARGGDILLLAEHFLRQAAAVGGEPQTTLEADAARRLLDYPWPGNIRELENAMERGVALSANGRIALEDLPNRLRDWTSEHVLVMAAAPEELVTLRTMESRYLRRVLAAVGGNRTSAARILGIDRKSLYRKMQRFGIATGESPEPSS